MKKEYEGVSILVPTQPSGTSLKPQSGREVDGTPRSIALMATMMYEIGVSTYGMDSESFRYSYLEYSDKSYGLRFYPAEDNLPDIVDPVRDHYKKQSAMLMDMKLLAEGERDIVIDPENLEVVFTNKAALLDVLLDLTSDEEGYLSTAEAINVTERLDELFAPMELPDNKHSKHEAYVSVARKFDSMAERDSEVDQLATLTFLPRVFGSVSEYKASLVAVLDADLTSCFSHILKTIQQEDKIDTRNIASEMNYGGYN